MIAMSAHPREVHMTVLCEPGKRPFATEEAARAAAADAADKLPNVRWDFPESDGGFFAFAYPNV